MLQKKSKKKIYKNKKRETLCYCSFVHNLFLRLVTANRKIICI